ncbi:MAG: putative replicase protein [Alehxovirus montisvivens]|uniref:RNA-directed RNA polymerase n=1 Tax=Leviviridae sp. TaxID=2027243 RepID=A0ABY3STF5_9VIRU|nr:MAG: putative replicase protein [Leviviridae sp.]
MVAKSYEVYLLGLYKAMLSSIVRIRPRLRVDCERDYSRLLSSVEKAGISMFLEYLPAMGKHFDICLSQRRLTPSYVPYMGTYKRRGSIPRLFKGLMLSVFDESGELRIEPDIKAVEFLRQLFGAAKRFRMPCSDSSTWEHVDEFFRIDAEVRRPSLQWDDDDFSPHAARDLQLGDRDSCVLPLFHHLGAESESAACVSEKHLSTIQWVADVCTAELGRFDPAAWRSRHGPGAVADLKTGSDKYQFPFWPAKLDRVFPFADHGFHDYAEWADYVGRQSEASASLQLHEPPSRLIAVPKTITGPRLIASEPVSHQWCQQLIRDFLMSRVSDTSISRCISFRDQSKNGSLALRASLSESHATIDLSNASDRLSCWLVERLFRTSPTLLDALQASRTRWIRNDIDRKSPSLYRLRKFTTMGSAVTFPVQTIIFTYIAIGSVLFSRRLQPTQANIWWASSEVQVFGDDIIVPSDSVDNTLAALTHLGLKVNPNKTFKTGRFRESCGVDAFCGHDVTKVSVLAMPVVSKPESVVSSLDTHNNFFMRGYYEVSDYIHRAVASLKRYRFFKVRAGSGAVGWYSFDGEDHGVTEYRWNPNLQRLEYRVTGLYSPTKREPTNGRSMTLQYFTEVTRPPISKEVRLGRSSVVPTKLRWHWEIAPN